ncbi:MAG: hypothetical protein H6736_05370 [Alphaproteobacteria bacterium]|nr:hypothetical protein [Alphaproteobacteria bacterium]MCB9691228.1 hypothetical protein [Alphaproteobacteria bacterium]
MRSRFGAGPTTSRLRAPDDGIVASSRGGGWMVDRWLDMLGTIERTHGARLSQGKNLARNGRVRGLWFSPGLASAQVVADDVYNVSIRFRVFTDRDWSRVLDALLENLQHVGALLEGELSLALVRQLESAGVSLIPTIDEIEGDCNCDDYMLPCAHMAAVHQVLAEALDGEPFLLFTLRGRPRGQLLKEMRKAWGDSTSHAPESNEEPAPEDGDWFRAPAPLPASDFRFHAPEKPAVGLRALGPPPGDIDLLRAIGPLYEAGGQAALDIALADDEPDDRDRERARVFRRSVQRPVQASASSGQTHLTEAIVDALAEVECARSKDLAKRVGAAVGDVRDELLDLEKLGIVYRTGQTRGTRWWLG